VTPPRPAVVVGTRPEAIKLSPVVRALEALGAAPEVFVTGQHAELLQPILAEYGLEPVENLGLMRPGQSLAELSARLLAGVDDLLARRAPQVLVVQGDTTSAAMSALSAFYRGIPVAHVEAGLRTGHSRNPFPEEMNRRLLACLASIHFAPTARARESLLRESVPGERIHLVGNTAIDALFHARDHLVPRLPPDPLLEGLERAGQRLLLVTAHRRESFGGDLEALCRGIARVAASLPDVAVAFPVHWNPHVRPVVHGILGRVANVFLLPPLSHARFVGLLVRARLVVTDSGGVQEEAAALGIPMLVVRRTTERQEAVEAGVGQLVPPDAGRLFGAAKRLLTDPAEHRRRAVPTTAFGDGHAAERIAEALLEEILGRPAPDAPRAGTAQGLSA
jgi:UDP-N-acetylglucosamine 2-epimerase (non-hydrolysing)